MHRLILISSSLWFFSLTAMAEGLSTASRPPLPPPGAFQAMVNPVQAPAMPSMPLPFAETIPNFSQKGPMMPEQGMPSRLAPTMMPTPMTNQPWAQGMQTADPMSMYQQGVQHSPYMPGMPQSMPQYNNPWGGPATQQYMPYQAPNAVYPAMPQNSYQAVPQVIYEWVPLNQPYPNMPYVAQPAWQGQSLPQPPTAGYNSVETFRPPAQQGTP